MIPRRLTFLILILLGLVLLDKVGHRVPLSFLLSQHPVQIFIINVAGQGLLHFLDRILHILLLQPALRKPGRKSRELCLPILFNISTPTLRWARLLHLQKCLFLAQYMDFSSLGQILQRTKFLECQLWVWNISALRKETECPEISHSSSEDRLIN